MNFDAWEPVYRAILSEFEFERSDDEDARDILHSLVATRDTFDLAELRSGLPSVTNAPSVAIAAPGQRLEGDIGTVDDADLVFAASTAADRLHDEDISIDCVVTDLDKHATSVPEFTRREIPVAIHAHGDNRSLVRSVVPGCDIAYVIPTTQAAPTGTVVNTGGFTDGDRAAFLADQLGVASLSFPGWDFDDHAVTPMKSKKLRWAERLLYWLERRRGERFAVLDGRREDISAGALPIG